MKEAFPCDRCRCYLNVEEVEKHEELYNRGGYYFCEDCAESWDDWWMDA